MTTDTTNIERLVAALEYAKGGFALAHDAASKGFVDECLLHIGHHEAKVIAALAEAEAEGQAVDAPDERQRWLDACSRVIHGDDGPSEDWNPSVAWEQAVMLVRSIALAAAPEAPAAQETKP